MNPARSCRGFSRLELLIVIIVFGICLRLLLDRLHYYQEQAEKAGMEQTAVQVQSGLDLQAAKLVIQGRTAEIPALAERNPMDWLAAKPVNYAGVLADSAPGQVAPGNWYYDSKRRELVYLVNQGDHFAAPPGGRKRITYRVAVTQGSEIARPRLEQTPPVAWFKKP